MNHKDTKNTKEKNEKVWQMHVVSEPKSRPDLRTLPRNIWAASLASFFTDISNEMILNILPLFLANVLGVKTNVIGLIEGGGNGQPAERILRLALG